MKYRIQERIFSLTANFWIEDEAGNRVFYVDAQALSLREAFELRQANGELRAVISQKPFAMRETMKIEDAAGGVLATVKQAHFSPIKHRYEIALADGSRLEAVGNFVDKDWHIEGGHGRVVGRISRKWFHIRDTYGVEVEPGEDDALVIAIAVGIERIREDEVREHREEHREHRAEHHEHREERREEHRERRAERREEHHEHDEPDQGA